jgi:hypothetical protein
MRALDRKEKIKRKKEKKKGCVGLSTIHKWV